MAIRLNWLARDFTTGEVASLALDNLPPSQVSEQLRMQLLDLTQTEMIVIRRDGASQVLAARDMPRSIDRHIPIAEPSRVRAVQSIMNAFDTLLFGGDRVIRVYGIMRQSEGTLELVKNEKPLRDAMLLYAGNVMLISLLISLATAIVIFVVLRWFLIRPLQSMASQMAAFATNPEDPDTIIQASGRRDEIGVTQRQLQAMQRQLRSTLNQQRHLADLGLAVSKINHDLRNILASASLFSDRLMVLEDPTVKRVAPRLIKAIDRAVDYTRSVLAYGKSGEALPNKQLVRPHVLLEDVAQVLGLDLDSPVEWNNAVSPDLEAEADPDQLYRVMLNLCRNAIQVMTAETDEPSVVRRLSAKARTTTDHVEIVISDTGPGFTDEGRAKLFSVFAPSTRSGGTGLGLAIAAELVRAHGGTLKLLDDAGPGAHFAICLPRSGQAGGK